MTSSGDKPQTWPTVVDTPTVEGVTVVDGIVHPMARGGPSRHRGAYFVLSGEVIDGQETYPAGSYVVFPAGSHHQPRTEVGAPMLGVNIRVQAQGS
jgi:hypothetical protein